MAKQIFLLYSCDEWKSKDTMILVCASTATTKIRKAIIAQLNSNDMEYSNGEKLTEQKQIAMFKKDWKTELRDNINDKLRFGFFDYVYDGAIQ